MAKVALIGSTSGIGEALAHKFHQENWEVILCGRTAVKLSRQQKELETQYSKNFPSVNINISEIESIRGGIEKLFAEYSPDGVVICVGSMPDQKELESSPESLAKMISLNLAAVAGTCNAAIPHLLKTKNGFISCITSVAALRGRKKNYLYGASKAGLNVFLDGLRHKYADSGLLIQTVMPGMVRTAMTSHLPDSPLMSSPEKVAGDIFKGILSKKTIVYTPSYWRVIMFIIQKIPFIIFRKLNF